MRAEDREALEHLLRYGLRGPPAQERLSVRADGRVVYRLRRPWPHARGVSELVLEPEEFRKFSTQISTASLRSLGT